MRNNIFQIPGVAYSHDLFIVNKLSHIHGVTSRKRPVPRGMRPIRSIRGDVTWCDVTQAVWSALHEAYTFYQR